MCIHITYTYKYLIVATCCVRIKNGTMRAHTLTHTLTQASLTHHPLANLRHG